MKPSPVTVDFETHRIEGYPNFPPKPVGVSIKYPDKPARYYAWGHVTGGNNSTREEAARALRRAWQHPDGILGHNTRFDMVVAEEHFRLPRLPWEKYHDTMLLLFLDDPNSKALGLKPSADRLLGMPPEERDAVAEWLWANQPVPGVKISKSSKGEHPPGAYIAYAPGDIVEPYANGDTIRTEAIFDLLWDRIHDQDMGAAYDRERRLMLMLADNEKRGLRIDVERLDADVRKYDRVLERTERLIMRRLGREFDISSKNELARALVESGAARPERLGVTKTGKLATNKEALAGAIDDVELKDALRYRGFLATALQTFLRPWLELSSSTGVLHANWNQVSSADASGEKVGTRTGRPSASKPNLLNVPKKGRQLENGAGAVINGVAFPAPPSVRSYVLPREKGHVLLDRDYSQQEPRLLAHFEGGVMMQQYAEDPWMDFHDEAKAKLDQMRWVDHPRKDVKGVNLGLIYGMGVPKMAAKNNAPIDETKKLKDSILSMYPGLKEMMADMKRRARNNEPIRTWGGRIYYCEPSVVYEGKLITFDYKLVNTLVQGSAADITKEAMLRYQDAAPRGHEFMLQVYDQIIASVPGDDLHSGMKVLRETMESLSDELDVPMLSEGDFSFDNWGSVKTYDKKGVIVWQAR